MIAFSIRRLSQSLAVLVLLQAATVGAEKSIEDIASTEKAIINSRNAIRSGIVSVTIASEGITADRASPRGTIKRYTLYFDGKKERADKSAEVPNDTVYKAQAVFTPDSMVRIGPDDSMPVQMFGAKTRPASTLEVPDARKLGMVVWCIDSINQFGYEEYFLLPGRTDIKTSAFVGEFGKANKVSFKAGKTSYEYVLAEECGNLPQSVTMVSESEGKRYLISINCQLKKYEHGGVWYPKSVVYLCKTNDTVMIKESTTVERAEFNQPIDDKVFTLAGMQLPAGRTVDRDSSLMTWTGTTLVPQTVSFGTAGNYDTTVRPRRWLLLVNAVVLVLIACAILFVRFRRSRLSNITP